MSSDGATLDDIGHALSCARRFKAAATQGPYLQPGGEQMLVAEGLDEMGDVLLRIYRGERKCDAAPVRDLAHLKPGNYSQAGVVAQQAVAWMRDIALILRDRPVKEWHDAVVALQRTCG